MRPVAPGTALAYYRVLKRAFDQTDRPEEWRVPDFIDDWGAGERRLLKFAIQRRCREVKMDPAKVQALLARIPDGAYAISREPIIPSEDEAALYEATVKNTLPPGKRALALLPLKLGLRAKEVLTIPRQAIQRAARSGELIFVRKGGREQLLPAAKYKDLFEELLATNAAPRKGLNVPEDEKRPRAWKVLGEIMSRATPSTAYFLYHRMIVKVSKAAGRRFHPHALRHGFATRMNRDGAPLATIQFALGHKDPKVTARYVHPDAKDVEKFLRD